MSWVKKYSQPNPCTPYLPIWKFHNKTLLQTQLIHVSPKQGERFQWFPSRALWSSLRSFFFFFLKHLDHFQYDPNSYLCELSSCICMLNFHSSYLSLDITFYNWRIHQRLNHNFKIRIKFSFKISCILRQQHYLIK